MTTPIASVVTMTGIHRTSPGDVARVLVDAYQDRASGGMQSVTFDVTVNGSFYAKYTVTSKSIWKPDDTDLTDPINNSSGPVEGRYYGIELNLSKIPTGTIQVVPTAIPVSGTSRVLDTVIIYNDTDGVNRAPCQNSVYVSSSGNNSNPGTLSLPVQSIQKAMNILGTNVGGGKIYLLAGTHQLAYSSGFSSVAYTGGHYWLTIEPAPGVTKEEVTLIRHYSDWLYASGTASGQSFRVRIRNLKHRGAPLVIQSGSNITPHIWCDGIETYSEEKYRNVSHPHVGFYDEGNGTLVTFNYFGPNGVTYYTGVKFHRRTSGLSAARLRRGCKFEMIMGVAINDFSNPAWSTDIESDGLYQNEDTYGYIANTVGNLKIVKTGNVCRVTLQSGSTPDFGSESKGQALIGLSRHGIKISSFPTSGNNGTFLVTGAGYDSGVPYIEYTNSSGASENSGALGGLRVARYPDGQEWETTIHSDLHQIYGQSTNTGYVRIRGLNSAEAQGFSCNGFACTDIAIIDCVDGKPNATGYMNSYLNGTMNHVIIDHCDFLGTWLFDVVSFTWSNCQFTNNIVRNYGGSGSAIAAMIDCECNHFHTGSTPFGLHSTSGVTWSDSDPGANGDYSLDPASQSVGSAIQTGYTDELDIGVTNVIKLGSWGLSDNESGIGDIDLLIPNMISDVQFYRIGTASLNSPIPVTQSVAIDRKQSSSSISLFVPALQSTSKFVKIADSIIDIHIPILTATGPTNIQGYGSFQIIVSDSFITMMGSGIKGGVGSSEMTLRLPQLSSDGFKVFESDSELTIPVPFTIATGSGNVDGRAIAILPIPSSQGNANYVLNATSELLLHIPNLISQLMNDKLGVFNVTTDVTINTNFVSEIGKPAVIGKIRANINLG